MMKKKFIFIALLVLVLVWGAGFLWFSYTIYHFKTDTDSKTDAIIVLTGGKNRISEAVKLLNQGLGNKLLISGVAQKTSLQDLKKRGDIALQNESDVTLDKRSSNTVENAIEAMEWIKKNHISSIRLVTSNYHILRSQQEFRALDKNLKIILHPVYSENVSSKWWKNEGSFFLIASEYNKFLIVWLRSRLFGANAF